MTVATGATSGKFKLYSEPTHVTDPSCDMYTELDLQADSGLGGTAKLADKFTGWCVGLVDNGPRAFTLTRDVGECRSRLYTGQSGGKTLRITDYRKADCAGPAPMVVTETADDQTTTMYFGGSLDEPLADAGPDAPATRDGGAATAEGGTNLPTPPCSAAACFYGDTRITGLDGCQQSAAFCYSIEACNKTTWCMRKK